MDGVRRDRGARAALSRGGVTTVRPSTAHTIAAYVIVLVGYLFYCYNFVVLDYVRPYLLSDMGFTLGQTAGLSVAQNIGITVGAILWAGVIARYGRHGTATVIALSIGGLAALQALSSATLCGWACAG